MSEPAPPKDSEVIDSFKGKLDPTDELPEELVEVAKRRVEEYMEKNAAMNTREINLMEDDIKVSKQRFALVSFIGPKCAQTSEKLAMKIYGVFETTEEAGKHAQKLQKHQSENDVQFNIFIQELYNWCPIPPDIKNIGDQYYDNEYLNDMINKHKENELLAKEKFNLRKDVLMGNESVNTELLAQQAGLSSEQADEISASELLESLESKV